MKDVIRLRWFLRVLLVLVYIFCIVVFVGETENIYSEECTEQFFRR